MSSLRNPILATIIYYDIFDFPLTLNEVCRYLVNPGRLTKLDKPFGRADLTKVQSELEHLVKIQLLESKNGFYFLPGRHYLYEQRIGAEKISAQKWKKFIAKTRWLAAVPYLRGFFASGSLALNNADHDSDFDVLTITKSGRLYTCRLFLSLATSIMGSRRKRYDTKAPDKFCLNHYLTDSSLTIEHQSLYNAQAYSNLRPVLAAPDLAASFYLNNPWLNKYVYNFRPEQDFYPRFIVPNKFLISLARAGEFILDLWFGNLVESSAKKYQQKRIRLNPATYESGGRVVFSDTELEFHPHSFELTVIDSYNRGLEKLGIISYVKETDSGLNN